MIDKMFPYDLHACVKIYVIILSVICFISSPSLTNATFQPNISLSTIMFSVCL